MHSRPRMQLLLPLDCQDQPHPLVVPSPDLLQALADLLLEVLGKRASLRSRGQEACDEPEDHA